MNVKEPDHRSASPSYEELHRQNLALRQEIDEIKAARSSIWPMLAETSRRLQISSASVKVAVSSLLDHGIFWDNANQHEFLETINASIDQVSEWTRLLVIAFRLEAGSLELRRETQTLPEVLSVVQDQGTARLSKLTWQIAFPREGNPVLVDYEYFIFALELLSQVFDSVTSSQPVLVQATESAENWFLDFEGLEAFMVQAVQHMSNCEAANLAASEHLSPDNTLRLYIACRILHQQGITIEARSSPAGKALVRLRVPALFPS